MRLEVSDLRVLYDRATVLNGINFHVDTGEFVGIVGPNGAGKTTALRAISGLTKWEIDTLRGTTIGKITFKGSIKLNGEELLGLLPHQVARKGVSLCPERGRPLKEMTIGENLDSGAYLISLRSEIVKMRKKVYSLFPILERREKQISGTLSGGERAMLGIGRSLMSQAKLLLIDEPSVGLAPIVKDELFRGIKEVHVLGLTILMVEQDVGYTFEMADRNYVMSRGKIIAEGSKEDLLEDELIRRTYLGL